LRSWEIADRNFTSKAFLVWVICIMLLGGRHVMSSFHAAVVAPVVALSVFACFLIFYSPHTSTDHTRLLGWVTKARNS
jgi:hypothetical protein